MLENLTGNIVFFCSSLCTCYRWRNVAKRVFDIYCYTLYVMNFIRGMIFLHLFINNVRMQNSGLLNKKVRQIVGPFNYIACLMFRSATYFCFSKSRISVSNFSSADGAGGAAGVSSFFFFAILLISFTSMNTQNATMIKSMEVCMKLP